MKKKFIPILLALCMVISMVTGCSSGSDKKTGFEAQAKKTFVFGDTTFNPENNEPDVNPHNDSGGWACLRYGVGETLFHYSDSMEIESWLAKSYELVDKLTWKITLQDNVYFTSGRHMNGAAVKECLDNLVKVHKRAAENLHINNITADGQIITIVTTVPVPALPNYLADPYGCIYDIQAGTKDGIVSATGPYKAVSLVSGQRINLVKNEKYWNGKPKIDEITVRTISDGDTLTMALQSGEIDAAYGMPYASYPLFQKDNKYVFTSTATSRAFFAWMNFKSEIIKDAAVRKAIAMGIDKKGFVDTLLNGNGYPAAGVFPSSFTFGNEAVHTENYNPEGAKKILEDDGWIDADGDGIREKDGKKLVIRWLTYPSRQELPLLAESVQATLKKIGMSVEINTTADHNKIKVNPDAWDVYASAMVTAPTGDPEYFFTYCSLDKSSTNNGKYHSDKLEQLAQEMAQTFDKEKRGKLAIEMQQTILDDNAYVFASHLRMSMIAKSKVTGLVAHPCDFYEITADLDIN